MARGRRCGCGSGSQADLTRVGPASRPTPPTALGPAHQTRAPPTVLTARKLSGRSSSSSPFRIFSRVLMEISRSFSWWWFSRSRHWAIVQSS